MVFGCLFGIVIRKIENHGKFYLWTTIIGIVLFVVFYMIDETTCFSINKAGYLYVEYYNTIFIALYSIGSTMALYGILYFIAKVTPNYLNNFCYKTSAAVNEIYIISWILIFDIFYVVFGLLYMSLCLLFQFCYHIFWVIHKRLM